MASVSDQAFLMRGYLREGGPPMLLASLFLPARAEFVSDIRDVVRRVLVMAAADEDARYSAQLVTSELVTNVVRHSVVASNATVGLALSRDGATLRIAIHDADPESGEPSEPDEDQESGRGLLVVEGVSDRWGVDRTLVGKLTWCELTAWPEDARAYS